MIEELKNQKVKPKKIKKVYVPQPVEKVIEKVIEKPVLQKDQIIDNMKFRLLNF